MSLKSSGVVVLATHFALEAAHDDEESTTDDQDSAHDKGNDIISCHNEESSTKQIEPASALSMLQKAEVIPHDTDVAERKYNQNPK